MVIFQAVLLPGEKTLELGLRLDPQQPTPRSVVEHVKFAYTDAHGRTWERVGSGQPVRLF